MGALYMPEQIVCGYFDCSVFAGLSESPERVRTLYEIEYYLEDGLTVFSDGEAYPIKRAHVLIGRPGQRCNSLLPFKTKYIKCNAEGLLAKQLCALPPYFPVRNAYEAERLFDEVIAAQTDPSAPLELTAKFFSLLSLLSAEALTIQTPTDPSALAVSRAKQYIDRHFPEPIKLSDIAAAASLSPSYFHAVFSSMVGMTPHDYLTERRVRAASELLTLTSLTMPEIAERCGFANQQYLGTIFKSKIGMAPAQYRKKHLRGYLL